MFSAVTSTGRHLDIPPNHTPDLITVGALHARDVHALCNDLALTLFPSAIAPLTEATVSAVTTKLVTLIWDMEAKLHGIVDPIRTGFPATWPILARSGFLRERALIDFVLARVAEDRLESKLSRAEQAMPERLLDHADPKVAEAVQTLLAANSLHRGVRGFSYQALRPELLHQLCWRLVAAIEVTSGVRDTVILTNARALLSAYDEGRTAQSAASKIMHFLAMEKYADLIDPDEAGLQLYVANLARVLEIDQDHILNLIDSASAAPLTIMLRGVSDDAERAMAAIYRFKGFSLTPHDIALFEQGFEQLEIDQAHAEVRRWAASRAQYLFYSPIGNT